MTGRCTALAALAAVVAFACGVAAPAWAQSATGDLVARSGLRVCADPRDLPFSDQQREGFENKIAELFGQALSLPVEYVWFPQVIGFSRNTLQAGRCDLVMGTVAGDETMDTTSPYYYTGYVMVMRNDSGWAFSGFDDPHLKDMHIGVVAGTPPANLLVRHGLMTRAQPYPLTVDTRIDAPSQHMISDIVDKKLDAGLLWGPLAGYYIRHDHLPLTLVMLKDEPASPRMQYHIAMGVRHNEVDWRRKINALIRDKQSEINRILADYGVPLLNEQGVQLGLR